MNIIIHTIEQLRWNQLLLKIIHILILKKEVKDKNPKFKVVENVRISKYKNIFAKRYTPNRSEEVFVITKLKIQFLRRMLLMISMVKKLLERIMKKNYKKLINKNLE